LGIKKRYILAGAVVSAFLFVLAWYALIYQPLEQQQQTHVATIAVLEQKKLQIPDVRYQVDVLHQHNEQVRDQLQAALVNRDAIDPYLALEHVLRALEESGLQLASFTPQEFKRKAFYERCTFGFRALGGYEQIMQFLNKFCEKNPYSLFKKVVISHSEDTLFLDALVALYLVDREGP